MKRSTPFVNKFILLSILPIFAACTSAPTIQSGPDAEVSFDGLHKVDNAQASSAWARPDFDLSGYTKLLPVSSGFEYRVVENRGRSSMRRNQGGPYFISDDVRARFEKTVNDVFQEELQKMEHWEFVTEPGPDVLIVHGGMLDITSNVPPETSGRSEVFLSSVGEVTLVLELRDSESNTILARSIDRRAAERTNNQMAISSRATNTSEVRRLARLWATRLVDGLDGFRERTASGN